MSRHAWAEYIESPEVRHLLWNSRERLKQAWEWDQKNPKDYPINTSLALAEIQEALKKRHRAGKARRLRLPTPKIPKRLPELISERTVRAIWEDNHSGSFEDAIGQAAGTNHEEFDKSWKVFQGIIRAIETAHLVNHWGLEFLGRPKVNILHKGLDEIAKAAGIGDQTEKGFAEFLDELCPCGLKSHREAVRKASRRSPQMRRPKAQRHPYK
jgi:hypothetical protein